MLMGIQENLLPGGVLSLLAGLSTGIRAVLALFVKRTDTRMLTFAQGASAGVMVYISFDELLPMAEHWGHHHLSMYGVTTGILVMTQVL